MFEIYHRVYGWYRSEINTDKDLYPLQIFLKEILVTSAMMLENGTSSGESQYIFMTMRYAIIVVSSIPLFCVYPFVQKHFQKGVMVGSVKG